MERKFQFTNILTDDEVKLVIDSAYKVLEETGVLLRHPEALEMVKKWGAEVDGERVKISRKLLEEAVAKAPRGFKIYNREGEVACDLTTDAAFFGTSTGSPNHRDTYTGEQRLTTVADIANGALMADALPNLDWVMPFGSAQDVPADWAEVYEFEAVVNNTIKPVVFCGYTPEGVRKVYEMAAAVVGGLEELKKRPFVIVYPEPITPLTYPFDVVERMFISGEWMQPQLICGAQQPGATSPISIAGTLVQGLAESLFSIGLVQHRNPGAPCFMAMNLGGFNMNNGLMSIVPPEASLGLAAQAQIARHFGFPSWGLAGGTDSKAIDAQAGAESAFSLLAQAQAGLSFIHDVGYVDMGMACSLDMMVMGQELISWVRRFMTPIGFSEKDLSVAEIAEIGPGGNYLRTRHTLQGFRKEYWRPELFERNAYKVWQDNGSITLDQKVKEKTAKILAEYKPKPLSDDIKKALKDILKTTEA